jgi:SAM-dependent methyltransferase
MLTEDETAKGCLAYYREESLRVTAKEENRNHIRNFRRGIVFGYSLKKRNLNPHQILELGPGSGYFMAGLKFVYPLAQITVMDVNDKILEAVKKRFHYQTIKVIPEKPVSTFNNAFDLIIARDFIEHVMDISKVMLNIKSYLKVGGIFHFITPNGHEDLWKYYLTYNYLNASSELLINHVNYFDGAGLLNYLTANSFEPLEFYTYQIKTTLRGNGWKVRKKLMAPLSERKNAGQFFSNETIEGNAFDFDDADVLNRWYINDKYKFLVHWIGLYHHYSFIKLPPELNVGHEIYGLFLKTAFGNR